MMKRRIIFIIILAILAVIAVGLYAFVIQPYYDTRNAEGETEPPVLLDGEALVLGSRISLFEQIERAQIEEIEVYNSHGTYTFTHDASGNFYIVGMEGASLDATLVSSLVVGAGYPITMERLLDTCDRWEEFGLGENDDPAWYRIKSITGVEHTVQIGDLMTDGNGFYCRYVGRDALYTISSSSVVALLVSGTSLVSPTLGYPMETDDYYTVSDFILYRTDDPTVSSAFEHIVTWITYTQNGYESTYAQSNLTYQMIQPGNYIPNAENYESILQTLMEFKGKQTLEAGGSHAPLSEEVLAKYQLDRPKYAIHYVYNGMENTVRFSERMEDGTMYAYSSLFNLVALLDGSDFAFLDWELIQFIDDHLFYMNIGEVSSIHIQGTSVNETFRMYTENETLVVIPESTRQAFDEAYIKNFRQLYMTLLTMYIDGYSPSVSTDDLLLQITITTHAGKTYDFCFYGVSTRHCYYTCNGEGEFYVLRDIVEKVQNDTIRLMNGEPVDAWAKN